MLVAIVLAGAALVPAVSAGAAVGTSKNALLFGPSVPGGMSSYEAQDLISQGWTVSVASLNQWNAMTTAQFASYQLLVVGDPHCNETAIVDVTTSESNWWPAVNGNVLVIGTDPAFHFSDGYAGAGVLINNGLAFAGSLAGTTNLYLDLSCSHIAANPVLAGIAPSFSIGTSGMNSESTHVTGAGAQLVNVTSIDLANWHDSVHEYFNQWPADFVPVAIVPPSGGVAAQMCSAPVTAADGTVGCPYIVARLGTVASGRPIDLNETRTASTLTLTWVPGPSAAPYRCTLLYGFDTPSSFSVTSSATSCTFYNLGAATPYGVSVAGGGGSGPAAQIFAPPVATTITCVRAHHVRRVTAVSARCPMGWRLKR